MSQSRCTIYEAYDVANVDTGVAILYTDAYGLMMMKEGNSFYVWARRHASVNDIAIRVYEKDLAEDSQGNVYCVDGLDVIIV